MRLLLAGLVISFSSPAAHALCVSHHFTVIAWNGSETALLIQQNSRGPEGGHEERFILTEVSSGSKTPSEIAVVSSDFSPGNGTQPQRVTEAMCAEALGRLGTALKKAGFEVGVTAEPCKTKSHKGFVVPEGLVKSKSGKRYVVLEANSTCEARCSVMGAGLKKPVGCERVH